MSTTEAPRVVGSPSRIRSRDMLSDGIRTILSRRGQTTALVAAVATAVALAVMTMGLTASARSQVSERFDRHANREVTATWNAPPAAEPGEVRAASVRPGAYRPMLDRVRAIRGVSAAAVLEDRGSAVVHATAVRPEVQAPVYASAGAVQAAGRLKFERLGRSSGGGVFVGRGLADQLGINAAQSDARLSLNGVDVRVEGIIAGSPRVPALIGAIVVDTESSVAIEAPSRYRVLVETQPSAAQQVARRLPYAIDASRVELQTISAPVDPTDLRAEIENDVRITLLAFTAFTMLAAVAALTNTMILAVVARKAEFGLRRAIGARARHIRTLVVTEAIMIGLVGGIAGLLTGSSVILGVSVARAWTPVLDPLTVPLAIAGGVVIGALSGVIAAARAVRIQPQEALRP